MEDIRDRVRNQGLWDKITTPEEAAEFIKPGMNVATSGFTSSGYPKAVPLALADRMRKNPFTINLWTGASGGPELDQALAEVHGIDLRLPFQTNRILRSEINRGIVDFVDMHLSEVAQLSRCGFLGKIDVAIIEACAITEDGNIIPTTSVGNSATFVQEADTVIVEINTSAPVELEGIHDVYLPLDPPNRLPIPIVHPNDRVGVPYIPCPIEKIKYIVADDRTDKTPDLVAPDENARRMSEHVFELLHREIRAGRMPKKLLPLQAGVGNVANAALAGFVNSDFSDLTVYTEVIQDGMFDLIDAGKLNFASGTALSPSPAGMERFRQNVERYKKHLLLRPQEISNSAEVIRRLGVIAMNTAIEVDIYGNVNSTHVCGTKIMNGIGGSSDFASNSYLTIFFTPSVAKDGRISCIVPMCTHVDNTEHDVDVVITEQGIADLRGKSPRDRARVLIENCSHPMFRDQLREYFERADRITHHAHMPHMLGVNSAQ